MHEHEHDHDHAHHSHPHSHEHTGGKPMSHEEVLALLTYMLDHNRSHAEELHNIAHALEKQGKHDAAALVGDAVHYFGHCNDKLEEALRLVKVKEE